ncbi:unnamed protein product [Didymodactylos carnosus]|uniref:Uncharacterized protein n=1 Tax=Didymodactylos carnosus TaxID=1234261 RepID=A0A814CZ99_9BILA|nr:unnamed protein product [Didymodactylos carnosus]CAF0946691.1 unnamed protein product [Didymodactylos carnosus]CAF3541304.1 unnamed protein product [Didymodactylos carnosus]CAF3722813.1 unnamed protein product [Didymodactylos carnosus]
MHKLSLTQCHEQVDRADDFFQSAIHVRMGEGDDDESNRVEKKKKQFEGFEGSPHQTLTNHYYIQHLLCSINQQTDFALSLINKLNTTELNFIRDDVDRSLLHLCVELGWLRAVEKLLDKQVDVNVRDIEQRTPIMLTLKLKTTEILKHLLKHPQISLNSQTVEGFTVLHLACIADKYQHLKLLLKHFDLQLTIVDLTGRNFFHWLAEFKSKKCLKLIKLQQQDDMLKTLINMKDANGLTPLMIAIRHWPQSAFVRQMLVMPSINVNSQDKHGKTILHWAIFDHRLVKYILDKCNTLNVHIEDEFGQTALDYAQTQQLFKTVEILKRFS